MNGVCDSGGGDDGLLEVECDVVVPECVLSDCLLKMSGLKTRKNCTNCFIFVAHSSYFCNCY